MGLWYRRNITRFWLLYILMFSPSRKGVIGASINIVKCHKLRRFQMLDCATKFFFSYIFAVGMQMPDEISYLSAAPALIVGKRYEADEVKTRKHRESAEFFRVPKFRLDGSYSCQVASPRV